QAFEDMGLQRIALALDVQKELARQPLARTQLRIAGPLVPVGSHPFLSDRTIHSQLLSTAPHLSIASRHLRMQRIVRSAHELGAQQTIALEPRAPGDRRRRLPLVVMPGNPAAKRQPSPTIAWRARLEGDCLL